MNDPKIIHQYERRGRGPRSKRVLAPVRTIGIVPHYRGSDQIFCGFGIGFCGQHSLDNPERARGRKIALARANNSKSLQLNVQHGPYKVGIIHSRNHQPILMWLPYNKEPLTWVLKTLRLYLPNTLSADTVHRVMKCAIHLAKLEGLAVADGAPLTEDEIDRLFG